MSIPQQQLDAIRQDRSRIVETVAQLGGEVLADGKVRCPNTTAHANGDRNPSAYIKAGESGAWHFKCCKCGLYGDAVGLLRELGGMDFEAAVRQLGGGNGDQPTRARAPVPRQAEPAASELEQARKHADAAHAAVVGDPAALAHLWETRGIDKATAERFRLGITGAPGSRFWTFGVCTPDERFVATKHHRADGQDSKSFWRPKGVNRHQVWPANLEPEGTVWVCPGELKALAVIAAGCAAFGITSGEGSDKGEPPKLPAEGVALLKGRTVALPADNDATGARWAEAAHAQLDAAGIDARIAHMGEYVSEPHADIGDYIVGLIREGKDAEAIRASLERLYEAGDPWRLFQLATIWRSPKTWEPAEHIPTGLAEFDEVLGGGLRTRAVHLLVGHPGQAKTQTAIQIATNAAREGEPVGIVSLELARDEVAQIVAAQVGGIPRGRLARGELQAHDLDTLKHIVTADGAMPLTILDDDYWSGGLNRSSLAEIVAAGRKRFGWRLVIVDYIGLLAAQESDRSEYESDLLNSAAFRRIARHNGIALLAVSALRKPTGGQGSKDITLADVLGAGRLGYDATTVTAIKSKQEPGTAGHPRGTVALHVLKSRFSGAMHSEPVSLTWHPGWGRVEDDGPLSSHIQANPGGESVNVHFSSKSDEWYTPPEVVERVAGFLGGIDLDPCSNSRTSPNVPASQHFTQNDDGLSHCWHGRVYMNPPYGRKISRWIDKLIAEHEAGRATEAIALLPARTDTQWCAKLASYSRCFIRGRLKFSGHENSAPFASMLIYLGDRADDFRTAFDDMGDVSYGVSGAA